MNAINPDLLKRLQETLLRCDSFGSDRELKAIFVDSRIAPWANGLPHATNMQERVNATIAYLSHKTRHDTGENSLVLLLQVLSDHTHKDDILHYDLAQLAKELAKSPHTFFEAKQRSELQLKNYNFITIPLTIGIFTITLLLLSNRLQTTFSPTHSPCSVTVQGLTFNPKAIQIKEQAKVTVNINNPEGLGIKYNWSVTDGIINPSLNSLQPNSTYTAPSYPTNQTIMVEVLPVGCKAIQFKGEIVVGDNPIVPTIENAPKLITTPIPDIPTSTPTAPPISTSTPTATPTRLPALILLKPENGIIFTPTNPITLAWTPLSLAADEYYFVDVTFYSDEACNTPWLYWKWTKEPSHVIDGWLNNTMCGNRRDLIWTVYVAIPDKADLSTADGKLRSEKAPNRVLIWNTADGGGGRTTTGGGGGTSGGSSGGEVSRPE